MIIESFRYVSLLLLRCDVRDSHWIETHSHTDTQSDTRTSVPPNVWPGSRLRYLLGAMRIIIIGTNRREICRRHVPTFVQAFVVVISRASQASRTCAPNTELSKKNTEYDSCVESGRFYHNEFNVRARSSLGCQSASTIYAYIDVYSHTRKTLRRRR